MVLVCCIVRGKGTARVAMRVPMIMCLLVTLLVVVIVVRVLACVTGNLHTHYITLLPTQAPISQPALMATLPMPTNPTTISHSTCNSERATARLCSRMRTLHLHTPSTTSLLVPPVRAAYFVLPCLPPCGKIRRCVECQ